MNTKFTLRKTFLLSFLLCSTSFWAQEWVKTYGGSNYDRFLSVLETSDGGYLAVGLSDSNNGDITDIPNGDIDGVLYKVSSTGSIEWQKNYGGSNFDSFDSIVATNDGGYVLAGVSFSDDGDLTNNNGSLDIWLLKIDAQGAILWSKTFGGDDYDELNDIVVNADGSFTIVGRTKSANFLNNTTATVDSRFFFLEIDASGNTILPSSHAFTINGLGGKLSTIDATQDGSYLVSGYLDYETDQYYKPVVLKIGNDGVIQWNSILQLDNSYNYANVIGSMYLTDGSYYIAGEMVNEDLSLGKGFLAKFDTNGNVIWQNEYFNGASFLTNIEKDANQNIWVTGSTFKNGTDGGFGGTLMGWLLKIDPTNGAVLLDYTFGGISQSWTQPQDLTIDSQGKITMVGHTDSNTGTFQGLSYGEEDAFMLKIDPTALGINESTTNLAMTIYPNPVNTILSIKTDDKIIVEKITIIDAMGKVVLQKNNSIENINVENLKSGLYLLQITTENNQVIIQKFLKQ